MALDPELIRALGVTAEVIGAAPTEAAVEAMAEHLGQYPTPAVLAALGRCQVECRGRFALADVIDRLDDGHLGAETAWALVAGLGEDDSVVWTDEIAGAYGVARGALPDRVAARLAFVEDYRRRLARARQTRRAPHWWPSLGWDVAGRAAVLREAVALGRLPAAAAQRCLPPAAAETIAPPPGDGQPARALVADLTRTLAKRVP